MDFSRWQTVVTWGIALLGSGSFAAFLNQRVLSRPKVSLGASVVRRNPLPRVAFSLVNMRKDEVHISSVHGVVKEKGAKPIDFLVTKRKAGSFRLAGLDRIELEAPGDDVFPGGYAVEDLRELYVSDVTTGRRWKLPSRQVRSLRATVGKTLKYYREEVLWSIVCRSCGVTGRWHAKRARPTVAGGYVYDVPGGWSELEGGESSPRASGLCAGCAGRPSPGETERKPG